MAHYVSVRVGGMLILQLERTMLRVMELMTFLRHLPSLLWHTKEVEVDMGSPQVSSFIHTCRVTDSTDSTVPPVFGGKWNMVQAEFVNNTRQINVHVFPPAVFDSSHRRAQR